MILLHIVAYDNQQANKIADFLLEKQLVLETILFEPTTLRKRQDSGKIVSESRVILIAKTKSLLFNEINEVIRSQFNTSMPEIYALPIVHMDPKQMDLLMQATPKI